MILLQTISNSYPKLFRGEIVCTGDRFNRRPLEYENISSGRAFSNFLVTLRCYIAEFVLGISNVFGGKKTRSSSSHQQMTPDHKFSLLKEDRLYVYLETGVLTK